MCEKSITMMPVAYTDKLDFKKAYRRPVEEILRWETWEAAD